MIPPRSGAPPAGAGIPLVALIGTPCSLQKLATSASAGRSAGLDNVARDALGTHDLDKSLEQLVVHTINPLSDAVAAV